MSPHTRRQQAPAALRTSSLPPLFTLSHAQPLPNCVAPAVHEAASTAAWFGGRRCSCSTPPTTQPELHCTARLLPSLSCTCNAARPSPAISAPPVWNASTTLLRLRREHTRGQTHPSLPKRTRGLEGLHKLVVAAQVTVNGLRHLAAGLACGGDNGTAGSGVSLGRSARLRASLFAAEWQQGRAGQKGGSSPPPLGLIDSQKKVWLITWGWAEAGHEVASQQVEGRASSGAACLPHSSSLSHSPTLPPHPAPAPRC